MGFKSKSLAQLQQHIRRTSIKTELVFVSKHARTRMKERKVTFDEVLECLRQGSIRKPPEEDLKTGCLICRMERYTAGRNLAACVALDDDDPSLVVVTVMVID